MLNIRNGSVAAGIFGEVAGAGITGAGHAVGAPSQTVLMQDDFNVGSTPDPAKWEGASIFQARLLCNYTTAGGNTVAEFPSDCTYQFDLGTVLTPADIEAEQVNILTVRGMSLRNVKVGWKYKVVAGVMTESELYARLLSAEEIFRVDILPHMEGNPTTTECWHRKVKLIFRGTNVKVSVNGTDLANVTNANMLGHSGVIRAYLCPESISWHVTFDNFKVTG